MMLRILIIIAIIFYMMGFSMPVSAEEIPVEDNDIVLTEEVDQTLEEQLEYIQAIITALVVSFTGTTTFALILRYALRKLILNAEAKVKLAEEENKIGAETAKQIYKGLEIFEEHTNRRIDEMTKAFREMDTDVKELVGEFKKRDEKLGELIKENLLDEEITEE